MNNKIITLLFVIGALLGVGAMISFFIEHPILVLDNSFTLILSLSSLFLTVLSTIIPIISRGKKNTTIKLDSDFDLFTPYSKQKIHDYPTISKEINYLQTNESSTKLIDSHTVRADYGELIIVTSGEKLLLSQLETTIGRDPECDICLSDVTVSRRHAILNVHSDFNGKGPCLTIKDYNSSNGTLVNGHYLIHETPLHNGDIVEIGRVKLEYHQYTWFNSVVAI